MAHAKREVATRTLGSKQMWGRGVCWGLSPDEIIKAVFGGEKFHGFSGLKHAAIDM